MSIDSTNSIQKPALSKIPSTRKSPRKRIFRENEYADFIANNAISIFDNITEKNCSGTTFIRQDDHIVLCRQIKKECHASEVTDCIRIDHELLVKLLLQGTLDQFHSGFVNLPFKRQSHKVTKHTQTIRRKIADELFVCV